MNEWFGETQRKRKRTINIKNSTQSRQPLHQRLYNMRINPKLLGKALKRTIGVTPGLRLVQHLLIGVVIKSSVVVFPGTSWCPRSTRPLSG